MGKLSGRLLRRRPQTRTCPAPTRPVVEQVACSTRDGDALEGVGEFCYQDQLPVEAGQRPLSTAWPPSARPRGRDRAAGGRTVVGGMCLMSSAACSSIACASQPVAALSTGHRRHRRARLCGEEAAGAERLIERLGRQVEEALLVARSAPGSSSAWPRGARAGRPWRGWPPRERDHGAKRRTLKRILSTETRIS